ncbi:hypothetical protein APHAL10511_003664 [Amanita phalloides]|nr:hypothetical protein APHAL10511_003664 [Amanita phalloides]
MKRGADKQLTKDSDASDDETEEVPEAFKKVDDTVLATRKIRSLPKRTVGGSVPISNGTSTLESSSTPKFSGFTGFGNLSASSAFTFAAPTIKSPGIIPPETQPQSAGTSSITPLPVSSTATSTAKTLASFLDAQKPTSTSSTSSLAFPLVKQSTTASMLASAAAITPPTATAEPTATTNDSAIKYYMELRGLNVSLLTAVTRAIQDDAFVDISLIIEQYKTQRTKIQDDYDRSKKVEANKAEPNNSKQPPAMPIPPSSFSFGNKTFGSSSKLDEPSNEGGFKPTLLNMGNSTSSPFKFPSIAPASSPELEAGKSTNTTFTFGTSSSNSAFGGFSKSDSSSNVKFSPSTAAVPATSPFGGSGLFGSPSSSSAFAQPTSVSPKLGFFGKPSGNGSIGNPVGFGFGSASSKDSNADTGTKTTSTSGFSFSQQSSSFGLQETAKESKKPDEEGGEEESACDDASAPTDDDAAKPRLSGPSAHDVEGEGEEDEETKYSVKLKAYRMKKPEESGGQGWVELGIGYLRLKKHKETNARRMLLRSSSTGRICINFRLYPGLKVSQTKKSLTFIGHGNGIPQSYSIRLPDEDQARQLKEAIEGEIAHLDPQEG